MIHAIVADTRRRRCGLPVNTLPGCSSATVRIASANEAHA